MRTLLALLLLPLTASAGTIPLATFSWSQPYEVTLPAPYKATIRMYDGDVSTAAWTETVTAFPHHSFAPANVVDAFNREILSFPEGQIPFWNGGDGGAFASNGGLCGFCQLHFLIGVSREQWNEQVTASGWTATMFVPKLGPNLWGYYLTDIERLVTADAQKITFHGMPIPEPASWLLVLSVCVWHIRRPSDP